MNNGRRVELDVTYNNAPFAGQVGAEIESLTYVDNAADDSDSIDITLDAQDSKWLHGWLPEEGATLRPRIIGRDWNGPGDTHVMECGLFILDDVAYQDAPTTLQVGGVSKPSDTDFSELERETIWKNTSIKRIGESIAGRYGLGFTYDADDYDIECDEQDGTDSSYYNTLCKNYGLILKVYAKRLWVYDRERYKGKRAVQDFDRTNIIPGSLSYNTTLSGTYTGGYFTYTDADKDLDIVCSVGGGNHTKNVNRRATSVYDASVQLCAEINNANHGRVKLKFSVMGNWGVSAGNNLRLTGYGDGLNGGIFKSITFDNGTEFAAAEGLERSCVNKRLPRTKVYFCHPYSSWERGTNENTNGMIRRRFPKGTNFAAVTNAQIAQAENWINNYPRKILGYKSSEIVFRECLRELGIAA